MHIEIYEGHLSGRFYWRLRAGNGRIVADGSEDYVKRGNAVRAARRVENAIAGSNAALPIKHL